MPPIRKGDGTPVAPKGISQVRTGDGRILFDDPAIPDSVVEDWEDGSDALNNWNNTGDVSIVDDETIISSHSADGTPMGSSEDSCYSNYGDGLNYYPKIGDAIDIWLWQDGNSTGAEFAFHFYYPSNTSNEASSDNYSVILNTRNDEFYLTRDGGRNEGTTIAGPETPDGWQTSDFPKWIMCRVEMEENNDITATVFDGEYGDLNELQSISVNDSTHEPSSGDSGVGFMQYSASAGGTTEWRLGFVGVWEGRAGELD